MPIGVIALLLPVSAYSAQIRMEYTLGFNGHFETGKWTPITIILENMGKSTKGSLEVVVTSGSEYRGDVHRTTYSAEVELPHYSKKLSSLTIMIKSITHELQIRFRKDSQVMVSESVHLHPFYTEKSLVVVVDPLITPEFLTVLPAKLFPVRVPGRYLPEKWYGYEGVGMLIVNSRILKGLRERQYRALKEWVRQGGFLIFSSEINYGPLLEKRFQDLIPMKIAGHRQVYHLKSLKTFSGQELLSRNPFFILKTEIQHANVIIQEGDIPIIVRKKIGAGNILFLAFDTRSSPFSQWENRRTFWERVLSLGKAPAGNEIHLPDQQIMRSLLPSGKGFHPNFYLYLFFMIFYLSFTGLFYHRLGKQSKRRSQHFLYLLSVITVFSLISYGLFFYPRAQRPFTYHSFLQLHMEGRNSIVRGRYFLGLFSVRGAKYSMSFGSTSYPVTSQFLESSTFPIRDVFDLTEKDSGQIIKGYVNKWSHIYFSIMSGFVFSLEGQAIWSEDEGLQLTIENRTPYEIIDCLLYVDHGFIELNNIEPNQRQSRKLTRHVIHNRHVWNERVNGLLRMRGNDNEPVDFMREVRNGLEKDILLSIDSKYRNDSGSLQLTGWIRSEIIHPEFHGKNIEGNGLTFIHWKLPVRRI